jgi:hypothetical protein
VGSQECIAWAARLTLSLTVSACSNIDVAIEQPKEEPFLVQVDVVSDPGRAVPGALIMNGKEIVSRTDDAGAASVRVNGKEGDRIDVTIKCPADYESPNKPLSIPLRRLASGSRVPHFEVRCAPSVRTFVVGVRAANGPGLPVMVLGREVARTDASGAALFVVVAKPSDQVDVMLNTTGDPAAELLEPRSPVLTFMAKDSDDFVVLDQKFAARKPTPRAGPPLPPRPSPL